MYTAKPPKGMRDFLPNEKNIRERVAQTIRSNYSKCGFTEIETSYIENLENLEGGDGGENQKLIFKILKRGEKLEKGASEDSLADLGLRFDLTLPLVRFYSNNKANLPAIFKSLQIGTVFRGERPQKGRFRAFKQCDVDIFGESSPIAEIEILHAIKLTLEELGFKGFEIRINDRKLLGAIIEKSGFTVSDIESIVISLDKLDKIGEDGVRLELLQKGFDEVNVANLIQIGTQLKIDGLSAVKEICDESYNSLNLIISTLSGLGTQIVFDHTIARGMGYYTGTIFEVHHKDYPSALAGGGRYDKMVEKFTSQNVPAVGCSIGFERICDFLSEFTSTDTHEKLAILISDESQVLEALKLKEQNAIPSSIYLKKKKFSKQLEQLKNAGYSSYMLVTDTSYTQLA